MFMWDNVPHYYNLLIHTVIVITLLNAWELFKIVFKKSKGDQIGNY